VKFSWINLVQEKDIFRSSEI